MRKILDLIQKWRFGAAGSAIATAFAVFGISWTIIDAAGIEGSPFVFLLLITISLITGFPIYHYLQTQRLLLIQRSAPAFSNSIQQSKDQESKMGNIGIVAPISSWATMFYVDIIRGIRRASERERDDLRRRLIVIDVPRDEVPSITQNVIGQLINKIDGLISINIAFPPPLCQLLIEKNIPVVNVHHEQSGAPFLVSLLPDHNAFEELMEHLFVEKECNTAVLVTKELFNPFHDGKTDPSRKEKRDIYLKYAKLRGLKIVRPSHLIEHKEPLIPGNAYILEIDRYITGYGEELFDRIGDTCPRSTAIVCLADLVAIGFANASMKTGNSVQSRGIRLSGFDNMPESEWHGITSIDYELSTIGNLAYSKIQTAIEHPGTMRYAAEYVKTRLVLRDSSNW